jgi:hypothetical protein
MSVRGPMPASRLAQLLERLVQVLRLVFEPVLASALE